jgi:excisionase family DNA binding protein
MRSRGPAETNAHLRGAAVRSRRDRVRPPVRFFTIPDVAESSQVSTRTVRRWIESGELIAHRFGRSVRVADDDLRVFFACRRED